MTNKHYWVTYNKLVFILAVLSTIISIVLLPGDLLIKGYYAICSLFLVSATISMSKAIRDEVESKNLLHKLDEAKNAKLLHELDE